MLTITSEAEFEAVQTVINMLPDECERNDDEHTTYAVLDEALARYEDINNLMWRWKDES